MTPLVFPLAAAWLFALGLYGVLTRRRLVHRLLAVNIMASSVFLLLVVFSARAGPGGDPVPQAMVLTGIVISVSVTAFALVLIRHFRILVRREHLESPDDD